MRHLTLLSAVAASRISALPPKIASNPSPFHLLPGLIPELRAIWSAEYERIFAAIPEAFAAARNTTSTPIIALDLEPVTGNGC
jgi:hypothetical protein